MKLVLWLLNDCIFWDPQPLVNALAVKSAFTDAKRHDVQIMIRGNLRTRGASVDAANARPGRPAELTLEGATWGRLRERDEYFVPIPVKVYGDRAPDAVKQRYPHWFGGDAWKSWWAVARAELFPFQVGMNSAAGVGYGEIVDAAAAAHGKNVLVGYSQAGLTARYLACTNANVAGFITVHAPNFGSPVARPQNADAVLDAVGRAVTAALGLTSPPFSSTHAYLIDKVIAVNGLSIDVVCGFLEAAVHDLLAMGTGAERYAAQGSAVVEGLKWLSGLRGGGLRERFAFYDLTPDHLDGAEHKDTVLGLVSRTKPAMPCGAVVGCNGRLEDLVLANLPVLLHDPARFVGSSARAALAQATAWYQTALADAAPMGPVLARKAREYVMGVDVDAPKDHLGKAVRVSIPARAHDCVIPSAYQVLDGATLGNAVNLDANHLSGFRGTDDRAPTDRDLVEEMLRRMGEALPA